MSFGNPAGLWLLLLIPLLIIIYIIRSRYEETPLSSTYIWKLSERFMKKTLPIQRFRRILLFCLQLLLVTLFALAAAKPMISDGLSNDYVVLIDCSAGMQVENEKGESRFEKAVKQVEEIADSLKNGHTLTVILAGEKASYLVKNTSSATLAKTALRQARCQFGNCNLTEALDLARDASADVKAAKVLFFTYREYEKVEGITLKNMSLDEWNLSFLSLTAAKTQTGTDFTTRLISYNDDASVTVGLKINGKTVDARTVSLVKDTESELSFTREGLGIYHTAEVFVTVTDGLAEDNFYALCPNNDRCNVLLLSKRPFYLQNALSALGNCSVTCLSEIDPQQLSGYDLYIFDGILPEEYPTDGGVLLFGSEKLPDGLVGASFVESEGQLTAGSNTSHPLFEGVSPKSCYVKGYTPLLGTTKWIFPLYCGGKGVFAVRNDDSAPLFAVCSFDLHNSNLPLQADFLILMRNVTTACLPSLVKDRDYSAESTLNLSLPEGTDRLYIENPDGSLKTLSFSGGSATTALSTPGLYTAVALQGEDGLYADFFVHLPEGVMEEHSDEALTLLLKSPDPASQAKAEKSVLFWAALLILLLILTEWGVYYYEQY